MLQALANLLYTALSHCIFSNNNFEGIMLKSLKADDLPEAPSSNWLSAFADDCRRRVVSLYAHEFQSFDTTTALTLIDAGQLKTAAAAAAADRAAGDGTGDSADTAGNITVPACIQCLYL
jgi:hypothetical protein